MSDGVQIEIPVFDDDDYGSAPPGPFGRHGFGGGSNPFGAASSPFGGGGSSSPFGAAASSSPFGAAAASSPFSAAAANPFSAASAGSSFGGSVMDSPGTITPMAQAESSRGGYFAGHSRGESVTSIDSMNSGTGRYTPAPSTSTGKSPFSHSASSSINAPTSNVDKGGFAKKSSFASIRNAFKSGGSKSNNYAAGFEFSAPPPVPQIDNGLIMKTAYNRSTSSLNTARSIRPSTPARAGRHAFNASDAGSDYIPSAMSPPPVPRVPVGLRSDSPDTFEEDKVVMDPKTPSDFALHAVFIRFASSAEGLIDSFLRQPMEQDILLPFVMGKGKDPKFDETLHSLGKIAQKHAKAVVDSILRWRRTQNENQGYAEIIKMHASTLISSPPNSSTVNTLSNNAGIGPPASGPRYIRPSDIPGILHERKILASIYIMCRALIAILEKISKDALGDAMGYTLEEITFETFRKPDLKLLMTSVNHRTNADLYAMLLGLLANIRFTSVTDRFLAEFEPLSAHDRQLPKDVEMKFENLVRGLTHVQIKVWPPEAFEEGAEFLETLSRSFVHAHGARLKTAFADTLVRVLHPIGKTAQAETNIPQWAAAIEVMYPKAKEMMSKPRYWQTAFPLVITLLCVAPREYFLKHWQACWESSVAKLKDKLYRIPVMNGLIRLLWTYLYRCQESPSTTVSKVEALFKTFFPPNRFTIFPPDEQLLQLFTYMVHFVLSRHLDFGTDLCLELMQEATISTSPPGSIGNVYAPERTTIAVHAVLLTLHAIEKDAQSPTWPSSNDFWVIPDSEDYPSSSDVRPASLANKSMVATLFERAGAVLGKIALACQKSIGDMNTFDEQWNAARLQPGFEESHNYVVRNHRDAGITVAYPVQLLPVINLLQSCFESWPRCLIIPPNEAIEMLLKGVVHVEPSLAGVACDGLMRFMGNPEDANQVVSQSTSFIFYPSRLVLEGAGIRLLVESPQLLDLWVALVAKWVDGCIAQSRETILNDSSFLARCSELEAAALLLLSHELPNIFEAGASIVRTLNRLVKHLEPEPSALSEPPDTPLQFVELLHGKHLQRKYMTGFDDVLDKADLSRLEQWRLSQRDDIPIRIVQSADERDRRLWRFIFPSFLHACMEYQSSVLSMARDSIMAAVSRYHPIISYLAGLSSRVPAGLVTRTQTGVEKDGSRLVRENHILVDQWCTWVKILCCTATLPESRPTLTSIGGREHTRTPSENNFERERLLHTRGLFRYLTPFLDSEYLIFRDAAVWGISAFPSTAYPQLLDDLSLLAGRQFYDDRSKLAGPTSVEQGIGLLNPRQMDEARSKVAQAIGDRMRRQERLHSAVARIYWHTAPYLREQRSAARQSSLLHVLKFVRSTQSFLVSPDSREDPSLHRLRRYFCGVVERLFNEITSLKDFDRFIPPNAHLTLYRLCEEWCLLGPQPEAVRQRNEAMLRAVLGSSRQTDATEARDRFNNDSLALSYAAVGAVSALCDKAFFPPESGSNSPTTESLSPDLSRPLTAVQVLDRFVAILAANHSPTQARGKKALGKILSSQVMEQTLFYESLRRSVVGDRPDSSEGRLFEVLSDIICNSEGHCYTFPQVACLALTNLGHPLSIHRRQSFNMLEAIHHQSSGLMAMSQFEASVGSISSTTYIHAHRLVSEFLAGEHPGQALDILTHLSDWLPLLPDTKIRRTTSSLLLESLECWVSNLELMTEDKTGLSKNGRLALFHLLSITLRYANDHMEQILGMWSQLVEPPNQSNGHATVRFLVEQSTKISKPGFINTAANIVSCLCQTVIGGQIFEDLVSLIDPLRMLPSMEHRLNEVPDREEVELWSDLLTMFEDVRSIPLSSAQYAWLFLADVAMSRYWEMKAQLPILLHAIFTHLDHKNAFVRTRAQRMLFHLLRAWAPGYDELHDRSAYPPRSALKTRLSKLEQEASSRFWKDDDPESKSSPNMRWLCAQVLDFLRPLCPNIAEAWGSLALHWGTACSIRHIAFRSLQIFRAIMPKVQQRDLALLLGRLSNTIAGAEAPVVPFALEIISTLVAIAGLPNLDSSLIPKLYWCAVACLSTVTEREFFQVLKLLDALLPLIDFDDPAQCQIILAQQPDSWTGSLSLQGALLKGLRSSVTSPDTLRILQTLARYKNSNLIEPEPEARLRDLYTLSLPWCLHNMSTEQPDPTITKFAEDIRALAEFEERKSIQKIMNSFVKGHFRTKDDFLRQSISSLREHYGADYWTEIVTLLMSLVLNSQEHVRTQAMNLIKILFQQRETRNPVQRLGSEILMPLLRLLDSDLAQQALDVLEEPMVMVSGGAPAKQVLRMSMHARVHQTEVDSVTKVFGVPEESGWCIAQAESLRDTCRANIVAVFDTCSMNSRPSRVDFAPEAEALSMALHSPTLPPEDDLGGLVQNLHELTSFFKATSPAARSNRSKAAPPDRRLEARVAAILAKSTATETVHDVPQTPFVDVFKVGGSSAEGGGSDDSDVYSDGSESEADAFMYDQPSSYRHGPKSHRS